MAVQARERILAGAITVGQRDGWAKLNVTDVLEESGVARRSLYKHFPHGASEIALSAVQLSADWITSIVDEACRQPTPTALATFVEHWTAMLTASDFSLGCPVAAAAAARAQHPEAAELAHEAFTAWESAIATTLVRDGVTEEQAAGLSVLVVATVEGAVSRCIAARSAEPMAIVHAQLQQIIDSALARG